VSGFHLPFVPSIIGLNRDPRWFGRDARCNGSLAGLIDRTSVRPYPVFKPAKVLLSVMSVWGGVMGNNSSSRK
jgi:hypothetical protein